MKFGLIGHPIEHSLSPALFRAGYDGRYPYDLIQTDSFEEAYGRFVKEYDGINITAPFKELALAKADIVTEECRLVGATNLLMKTPEGITAYNSDYRGLCVWLHGLLERSEGTGVARFCQPQFPLTIESRRNVLIVGMGGAGKAAAAAAKSLGCDTVLMNRTRFSEDIRPLTDFRECFRKADIIIYNLPVRIPELDELTAEDFQGASGAKHILEANYRNPSFDACLLKRMKEANPKSEYTPGQTWLLLQAMTGYEIFTGETPDLSKMSAQI